MLANILAPYLDFTPLMLRLALGIILIKHGWPKLFGPEPGIKGFAGWLGSMGFPVPVIFSIIVVLLEVFGGAAMVLGLLTGWIAIFIAIEFLIIIFIVKKGQTFGDRELDFLMLAIALTLILLGSGSYSFDALLNIPF